MTRVSTSRTAQFSELSAFSLPLSLFSTYFSAEPIIENWINGLLEDLSRNQEGKSERSERRAGSEVDSCTVPRAFLLAYDLRYIICVMLSVLHYMVC